LLRRLPTNNEQYRIFSQGATGFVPLEAIQAEVEQKAKDFCNEKNKTIKRLKLQTSKPPHILGNFPRAEITFICVDMPKAPTPDAFEDVMYIRLKNLKQLLNDGILTNEEFEKEKAKILNQ
jgi:hypothetical protein